MKVPFYSIRDKLAGFGYPTVDLNDQTARRNFAVAVNNPQVNSMSFAPGDYDLYKVGFFDTETGQILSLESGVPEFVVSGTSVFNVDDNKIRSVN